MLDHLSSVRHGFNLMNESFVVVGSGVCLFVCFSRQDFFVALEPILEVALVDKAGLELTGNEYYFYVSSHDEIC